MAYILVIEPDSALASTVERYLVDKGFEVGVVLDAQAAITHSDTRRPDAVVLELALPNHNGIEFLQEFRSYSDWMSTPVVIYSHIPPEDTGLSGQEWRQQGVHQYLYKPANGLAQLARVLRALNEAA